MKRKTMKWLIAMMWIVMFVGFLIFAAKMTGIIKKSIPERIYFEPETTNQS